MQNVTREWKQFVTYAIGTGLKAGLSFLLLPLYMKWLTMQEFGVISVLLVISTFGCMVGGSGLMGAYHAMHFEEDKKRRPGLAGTVTAWYIVSAAVMTGALAVSSPFLSSLLFKGGEYTREITLVGPLILLTLLLDLPFNILRLERRATAYVTLAVIRLLMEVVLKYVFIVTWDRGVMGFFESSLLALALTNIVLFVVVGKHVSLTLDMVKLRRLLHLGLPFVLTGFAVWSLTAVDRLCLDLMRNEAEVAIYAAASKFGSIFDILVFTPISLLAPPFVFGYVKTHSKEECREFFRGFMNLVATIGTAACGILSFLAVDLMRTLITSIEANPAYMMSRRAVPIIMAARLTYLLAMPAGYAALAAEKTSILAWAGIFAAVLNIGFNILLITEWGAWGAALATTISFISYALLCYGLLHRHVQINWDVRSMAMLVVALLPTQIALGAYLFASYRPATVEWPLLSLMPLVVVVTGGRILQRSEVLIVKGWNLVIQEKP